MIFSQEQQTLLGSYVGKPYSKWPFEALQLLTKQQFRELVLAQIDEGSAVDRNRIKFTF